MSPEELIAEARKWIGTPFKHDAEVLGAGCDCAHLINAVFSAAGKMPHLTFPQYSPDWWKHTDAFRPAKQIICGLHVVAGENRSHDADYALAPFVHQGSISVRLLFVRIKIAQSRLFTLCQRAR